MPSESSTTPVSSQPHNTLRIAEGDSPLYWAVQPIPKVPPWIVRDPELDARHYWLYSVILDYQTKGNRFPSRDELASDCGVSPDAITEWLKKLKERGWISWRKRFQDSNEYSVFGPDGNPILGGLTPPEHRDGKSPRLEDRDGKSPRLSSPHQTVEMANRHDNVKSNNVTDQHQGTSEQSDSAVFPKTEVSDSLETATVSGPKRRVVVPEDENQYWTPDRLKFFEFWWKKLPRKLDKPSAKRAWRLKIGTACDDRVWLEAFFASASKWLQYWHDKELQFVAHPTTWLNNERWNYDPFTGQELAA